MLVNKDAYQRETLTKWRRSTALNGSQLAKMKEYSWHVNAIKCIG